jgi:hypothetical protein
LNRLESHQSTVCGADQPVGIVNGSNRSS